MKTKKDFVNALSFLTARTDLPHLSAESIIDNFWSLVFPALWEYSTQAAIKAARKEGATHYAISLSGPPRLIAYRLNASTWTMKMFLFCGQPAPGAWGTWNPCLPPDFQPSKITE